VTVAAAFYTFLPQDYFDLNFTNIPNIIVNNAHKGKRPGTGTGRQWMLALSPYMEPRKYQDSALFLIYLIINIFLYLKNKTKQKSLVFFYRYKNQFAGFSGIS
jgi:hypothetical protein